MNLEIAGTARSARPSQRRQCRTANPVHASSPNKVTYVHGRSRNPARGDRSSASRPMRRWPRSSHATYGRPLHAGPGTRSSHGVRCIPYAEASDGSALWGRRPGRCDGAERGRDSLLNSPARSVPIPGRGALRRHVGAARNAGARGAVRLSTPAGRDHRHPVPPADPQLP